MEVEWLILADSAQVTGGKLFLLGGGWDRVTANSFPFAHNMSIAVSFRVPWCPVSSKSDALRGYLRDRTSGPSSP